MEVREYLRIALDPLRLTLLGRAAEGSLDVAAVAAAHHVSERVVLVALGKLRAAGLVGADDSLNQELLRSLAMALPQAPAASSEVIGDGWSDGEAEVLRRFFSGDRLTAIPTSQGKRRVILERLAQEFEPGLRYQEAEVNFTLQMFHADYAALRRYLVDEGLLTRADGVYWRTGGRYEPADSDAAVD